MRKERISAFVGLLAVLAITRLADASTTLYQISFSGSDNFGPTQSVSELNTFVGDLMDVGITDATWVRANAGVPDGQLFNTRPNVPDTVLSAQNLSSLDSIQLGLTLSAGTRARIDGIRWAAAVFGSNDEVDIVINNNPVAFNVSLPPFGPETTVLLPSTLLSPGLNQLDFQPSVGGPPVTLEIDSFALFGAIGAGDFSLNRTSIDFGDVIRSTTVGEFITATGEGRYTASASGSASIFDGGTGTTFSPEEQSFIGVLLDTAALGTQSGTVRFFDGNSEDIIPVTGNIVNHSNASLNTTVDTNTLTIDLGDYQIGEGVVGTTIEDLITNFEQAIGTNAAMDFDTLSETEDTAGSVDLSVLFSGLASGASGDVLVEIDTDTLVEGDFSATYILGFSEDDAVTGRRSAGADTVRLTVNYSAVPEPTSLVLLACGGLTILRRRRG